MRKRQSSLTAAGNALARAVESERPADERICYDPDGRQFVPAWMYFVLGFFIRSGYAEMRGPGVNGFLMARERYIDGVLQTLLNEDLQQLVILGAGYDSHSYRFNLQELVKTLTFVVNNAAPGSAIVFDYIYQAVLDDFHQRSEVSNMRRYRFMTGEGLTFGIPEGTVDAFLDERGFQQVKDISSHELKTACFAGKNASRKEAGGYGIVIGKV